MTWIGQHNDLPPQAVHDGVIVEGDYNARYSTRQPAPTQWIAVAVVALRGTTLHRLLVGEGSTADEAIHALHGRMSVLSVRPETAASTR